MADTITKVTMKIVCEKIDDSMYLVSTEFYAGDNPNNVQKEKKANSSKDTLKSFVNDFTDEKIDMVDAQP